MASSTLRYCVSLLLLTSIASSAGSDDSNDDAPREPRVTGRIVKLYSGAKPEPYVCPGEGFQPDPSNCASFFRCVQERNGKFTVFRYQCAPGTVYDPDLETCNHPRSTRRTECGGTLETTVVPHFTIKNNDIDGAQSEVPRPISTKEPVYTEQTTLKNPTTLTWTLSTEPQNISTKMPWKSTKINSPGISHSTSKFSDVTTTKQWIFSTQRQTQTTSGLPAKITQPSNFKNIEPCTSDGFVGDSENCRIFYRCVGNSKGGYAKYEFSCSESTVWDDEIQGCNHPWAVKRSKCGRSLSYDSNFASEALETGSSEKSSIINSNVYNGGFGYKTNKTIQQQLQISHGSEVTQTQVQISNTHNVIQNKTQINYGDKVQNSYNSNSKQNQTQISHGTAVSQTQTEIDYGNKGIQTQLQIDHSIESSQYQVQVQKSTTQSTTNHDSNEKNVCSESGFMGDSSDCKKFYRCVNNGKGYTKYHYNCGDGTVWDPEIEACNHAWAVKQCGGKVTAEPTTQAHTTSTSKPTEYTQHTKTTTGYTTTTQISDIADEDNIGYGNQNSQDATSTSSTTTTTSTEKSTTNKPIGNITECTSTGFMGDMNDCKIFYRCVDNGNGGFIKYEFKCGEGTVWDSNIEACNHAWAVKNCGGSSPTGADKEETTTKKYNTTPLQSAHTTVILVEITTQASNQNDDYDTGYGSQNQDTLHSSTATTSKPTKKPEELDETQGSECKSSGFIGDANDCKKFYRCVDNGNGGYIKYEFACGQGTVWDSKIEACNHAWAVEKCGESNSIETSFQTTTTTNSGDTSSTYIHTTNNEKETSTMASSTSVQSGNSNKCSSSGFMRDRNDCKKFYRCVDNGDGSYTRYEFTCGDGTVWDSKIEACNHVWAVEKCGTGADSSSKPISQQTTAQITIVQNDEQENGYATPSYTDAAQTTMSTSSSSTFTTTGESSLCRSIGFMGDKTNCKKFYRCVDNGKGDYDRYEFQCGEGTVWDESIEACNHAWAVKNCDASETHTTHLHNENITPSITSSFSEHENSQASTEKITTTTKNPQEIAQPLGECKQEGFYGDKKDCKKFYRCVDNGKAGFTKYEFKCGEGTSWNQDIQGCDHISPNRLCGALYEPLSDDMGAPPTTKSTTSAEDTETNSPQSISKPQGSDGTCDSEGFNANPSDCKKFYRCVDNGNGGFTKFDFICGDGTTWNQEIQACDHESDKLCTNGSSNPTHTTASQLESTTSAYSTTKSQDNTVKTTAAAITAGQCTSEGFYPHPNDCKKFVRCVDNGNKGYTQYEFSCGDGTVWVQEIQACDHDNDVNSCNSQVETISQPSITDNNASSLSSSTGTSSTETMPANKEDDEYNNGPSQNENEICISEGYFGYKQDCQKFYRCVDNGKGSFTKYDFACGEGTAWDSDLETCNHINEVKSCSGSIQVENENHQTTTNKNQVETDGTSSTTKATTSSESSSSNSNSKDTCESEGYFGDSKDCKKFYRCVDNGKGGYTKYDYTCGDGTIWDQDITTCNHPQDVSNPSCGSNQGTSEISSTTSSTISPSSTSSSTESSNNSQNTSDYSQESSKKPTNNNVTCNKAGYYSNPNDCKKFYRCVDWDGDGQRFSVFHFECGEGTIWDPALDTCNHEESVYPQRDCSQTQAQNVEGQSTTEESTATTTEENTTTTTEENATTTTEVSTTTTTTTTEGSTSTTTESTTSAQTTQELTTQEPTTSEKTTTEQSNEPTTTKQTTTSEKTTTRKPTTSEQTTTSEKTTTQESTTSEQSTTQQPTTSEQSTTQQSTTSEQTTAQQSTSEQTTTQQTTSEQTTTQTSTSSVSTTQESTTTQQSTTADQTTSQESTTTQQSTTTDQSTTQESTTKNQNTSEQPITTTQKSPTSSETGTEGSNESTTTEQTSDGNTTTQQSTDGTTTTQQTTTEETTDQSSTQTTETSSNIEESSSDKECPEADDDQYLLVCPTSFRRHPKYCNMFYQCTEDEETYEAKMAMFKCPNNTIYDESQTQCVSEDKADKKCDGETANKRRFKRLGSHYKEPIVADKGKQTCSTTGYFSFEKHSECAKGFLKCERSKSGVLQGYVYQCPDGFIYWSISKRCERLETIRDCKRSSNDWTGRWNIPVERNNVAKS